MGDATHKRILIKGGAAGQCQNLPAVRFDGDGSTDHSIQKFFGAALQHLIDGQIHIMAGLSFDRLQYPYDQAVRVHFDLSPAPLTPQVILVNLFGSKFSDEFTAAKIRISSALELFGIDFA